MNKILTIDQAIKISQKIRSKGESIVVGGGCFDILHIGHIRFLEEAKKLGNRLFLLLESDKAVKSKKGENRPINSQKDRANILSALEVIDYIILLPEEFKDNDYDRLLINIKPDIIATTKGDQQIKHKIRQAEMVDAKVVNVINKVKDKSTSRLARLIHKKFLL